MPNARACFLAQKFPERWFPQTPALVHLPPKFFKCSYFGQSKKTKQLALIQGKGQNCMLIGCESGLKLIESENRLHCFKTVSKTK